MLCFRCGSYNVEDALLCSVCGQKFEPKQEAPKQKATTGRNVLFGRGDVIASRYVVKDMVGQGGVGAVYQVHDKEVDVDVALKVISPNLLQTEEERKLFSRQMRQARKLHHPNIIRIYDEGHEDGKRFITMKLLDGLTLRKVIKLRHDKGQPFLVDEVIPIIHQIAAALDYAHKTTWHGDLKPENVIILPDLLKITDFNLVKSLPLKPFLGIAKTRSTGFFYIAPELRMESSRVDGRCDIFSLGVILCEMLTGVVYEGHFSRPLISALEELPARVDGLIRRALAEHPDGRYKKAVELAKDLETGLSTIASDGLPVPVPSKVETIPERSGRRPPPPPAETSPGMVPDRTDEEAAAEPSLEELGPSQVVMIPSGLHGRAKEGPEDIPFVPPPIAEAGTSTESVDGQSHEAALAAEGIIETLYREDDGDALVPPPLPDDADASDSYSHQRNPALGEDTDDGQTQPAHISQDSGEEETKPDLDAVGIHEELTALKKHPAPQLMADEHGSEEETATVARAANNLSREQLEEASERSSPRRHAAEGLPPPVVAPTRSPSGAYVPPSMRPVSPPPRRRKSAAGLWITVITLLSVAALLVALLIHKVSSGPASGDPKPGPVVIKTPDAGARTAAIPAAVTVDAGPRIVETQPAIDEPDPPASDGMTDAERRERALELARKNASEFNDQTRAEAERKRALEERVAARKREEALKAAASDEARERLLQEQRRAADEAARAEAERVAADAAIRKKAEEARRKAEEEARLAALPKEGKCPKGMAKIKAGSFQFGAKLSDDMRNYGELNARSVELGEYCIDYYEFPNGKSKTPTAQVSWSGAQAYCKRKGKRLCSEQEWEKACKGPANRRFPYGNGYNAERCNTQDENGNDRQLASAKDFARCRSGYTVFSLSGNVEEWTSDSFKPGAASKAVKGGAVDRPDFASRCAARRGVSPGTRRSTLGFRCCADPK